MSNQAVVEQNLPKELREQAQRFDIPDEFLQSETNLVVMILQSRSIDTKEEKQNWFNLLPLMNGDQMEKLRAILVKEKTKLKEIEDKYEKKKEEIKEKYLNKREESGANEKVQEIKDEEKSHVAKDHEEAEDLLDLI